MSSLSFLNLEPYFKRYGVRHFVETGSGEGGGISYAIKFPFVSIYSTEILKDQAEKLNQQFSGDGRVTVVGGSSVTTLDLLLPNLNLKGGTILFWLDAHYPGGDLGRNSYDYEQDLDLRLPLEKELETIRRHRLKLGFRDVIICDDLRIYERGPFTSKNLDEIGLRHIGKYDSGFLDAWSGTHNIIKLYEDTGIVIMEPK